MEIKYKSNLVAGIVSIILGIVCIILVPLQIAEDYSATYGITSVSYTHLGHPVEVVITEVNVLYLFLLGSP